MKIQGTISKVKVPGKSIKTNGISNEDVPRKSCITFRIW